MPITDWSRFISEGKLKPAAIVVCLRSNCEFLIIRRSDMDERHGQWTIPGGHVEDTDHSIENAAIRELEEETGLICDTQDLIYLGEPKPEKYYYLTKRWSGILDIDRPNPETGMVEHDDCRWATIEEIKDIDNSEIPIYLLEKALEMSKNG